MVKPGGDAGGSALPGPLPSGPGGPPTRNRVAAGRFFQLFLPIAGTSICVYSWMNPDKEGLVPTKMPPQLQYLASQQRFHDEPVANWSATHEATPKRLFHPESEQEVEEFIRAAHGAGQRLRVAGSCLSPNGLCLSDEGMMALGLLDKIVRVDVDKKQVTVQAGVRVQQLADFLKPHGLTLQNYASIREQQIGGFTQVGAHGTGATIPPVDETIVSLKMVTPAVGTVTLSHTDEPEMFSLAKVGLGALGVVTQLTLQCVPRHRLVEKTFTASVAEVKKNHATWLRTNRHLRYMWLPYTDSVVVVACNPLPDGASVPKTASEPTIGGAAAAATVYSEKDRVQAMRELYLSKVPGASADAADSMSFAQFRQALLGVAPLDKDWVSKVNQSEEAYWKRSSGTRVAYSDEILGFECGGQQWVLETAFPVADSLASIPASGSKDMLYMDALMAEIKKSKIAAPCPIEQRWTSGSSSAMSPAAGPPGSVHSWVGVIQYLPDDPEQRAQVTQAFKSYATIVHEKLMPRFNATWHWAKLEPEWMAPSVLAKRLAARFPTKEFGKFRMLLDPRDVLGNAWLDKALPLPSK
ncbi:hypothetical protein FOA52_004524 [Chlamydomonas sp. UWO 241]|nr:hypothetical protein FOA52_004524 [Chlamydomonas sp. UWO 241]